MPKLSNHGPMWAYWTKELQLTKCRFRMTPRKGDSIIQVREVDLDTGKTLRQFTSKHYKLQNDRDIEACAKACLEAHQEGSWGLVKRSADPGQLTWQKLAENCLKDLRQRVPRIGSRKNTEGHLRELSSFSGRVTIDRLEAWALERDPINQPAAFRNRLETISHIGKAGDLDTKKLWESLKEKRPTGSAKKINDAAHLKVRVIPMDEQIEEWLDGMSGLYQWLLALWATYGLRPSEAWHVEKIDEDGWITVPGPPFCKTARHHAPPVRREWLERYQLRENFEKYQRELNERFPIVWDERRGQRIPTNNSVASNAVFQMMERGTIPKLWGLTPDGTGKEWVRPYDLRHSYAIRCETSQDPQMLSTSADQFAAWLGHSLEMHRRIYLRWLTSDREKASKKSRFHQQRPFEKSEVQATKLELPLEVVEQLEQLAAIKRQLGMD